MWPGLTYWAGICAVVGVATYALLRRTDPMGDDETSDMLGLGGGSLAQEFRRHRPDATDHEMLFHDRKDAS